MSRKTSTLKIPHLALTALLIFFSSFGEPSQAQKTSGKTVVRVLTRDGKLIEGTLGSAKLSLAGNQVLSIANLLSLNLAGDASSFETDRISADLTAIQGADRTARDLAVAEITDIGLPALTPLLNTYKDRDLREPDPLYRLFSRLIPGRADLLDRTLDLVRLKNGELRRGRVTGEPVTLRSDEGAESKLQLSSIRSLAVRQPSIEKTFEVHALRHCTPIDFLDTGIVVGKDTRLEISAEGFVRLSFAIDGWASDADGIKVPGPNYKTNLVDGFPFGALVGKIGVKGSRFLVGRRLVKAETGEGRLYLAVNDNGHWQNNIGSFRVRLKAVNAYDLGDAQ